MTVVRFLSGIFIVICIIQIDCASESWSEMISREFVRAAFGTVFQEGLMFLKRDGIPALSAQRIREAYLERARQKNVAAGAKERINTLSVQLVSAPDETARLSIQENLEFIVNYPWRCKSNTLLTRKYIETIKAELSENLPGMGVLEARLFGFIVANLSSVNTSALLGLRHLPALCIVGPYSVDKGWIMELVARTVNRPLITLSFPTNVIPSCFEGEQDEKGNLGRRCPGILTKIFSDLQRTDVVVFIERIDELLPIIAEQLTMILDTASGPLDRYLGVAPDCSQVILLGTAQSTSKIHPALKSRMDFVYVTAISEDKKVQVAKQSLLERAIRMAGFSQQQVSLSDDVIRSIIRRHTNDPGVDQLANVLGRLFSEVRKILEETGALPSLEEDNIDNLLGPGVTQIFDTDNNDRPVVPLYGNDVVNVDLSAFVISNLARVEAEKDLECMRETVMGTEKACARKHLEWILSLPWSSTTPASGSVDLLRAKVILNEDHFGLKKVKERVLDHLAVKSRKGNRATILCFVGPSGVGKTSVAKSIARCMGRKFERAALGGVWNEATIRGYERSFVDARPGRIIQAFKSAGVINPVILLDEIDKLGGSAQHGDPYAALLEVLDPEQNHSFVDAFLGIPFDLSQAVFIVTANSLESVPASLLDRLEVINLSGYTLQNKIAIAKKHLIPKLRYEIGGLPECDISDDVLRELVKSYTREAGVRGLERQIRRLFEKALRSTMEQKEFSFTAQSLNKYLGAPLPKDPDLTLHLVPGVATGLAWTSYGGVTLAVEVVLSRGKKKVIATGLLKPVTDESIRVALGYVRAHAKKLGIDPKSLSECDFHIHMPAGAVPVDGPSAGVALVTALVSALTEKSCAPKCAMTGEIDLHGNVWPVGGLKEKILAAKEVGIKKVFVPDGNRGDVADMEPETLDGMELVFVSQVESLLGDVGLLRGVA